MNLRPLACLAHRRGVQLYLVGGCVRDGLRGAAVRDVDLVAETEVASLARACVRRFGGDSTVFDRFGTVRMVLKDGSRIDFARARTETYAHPAALPVVRPAKLSEDLRRRDFTVNAMARPLTERGAGPLIDPFGGAADLRARRIRILHDESFTDDPTRIFRAARYAGRLGFRLEDRTAGNLRAAVGERLALRLSRERVRQELMRILEEESPTAAMRRLRVWNMFPTFYPGFRWPKSAEGVRDPFVRLGLCSLAMGEEQGTGLLASLPLPRPAGAALLKALKVRCARRSPREELPSLTVEVLRCALPETPATAFLPLFLTGEDLRSLGLPPGAEYARWLDRAARRQWRGVDARRSQAWAWLRQSVR